MANGVSSHRPRRLPAGERGWLLAIDTSTGQAGIALTNGENLAQQSWPAGRQQTTMVLPAIEHLLSQCAVSLDQVGAVAVATGPGSFTGLRVGMSVAKGFVLAAERAMVGVATLDLVAAPCVALGIDCVAVIPAGRGRVVWARYDAAGGGDLPRNSTFEELLAALDEIADPLVIGELAMEQRGTLAGRGVPLAPAAMAATRAGVLAEMGFERWGRGEVDDAATLEPLYLHGRPNPR
jgi:tRNA threonylcarbamoyladenosine biosynthesis protein TsaB